jgi:outer membrane protein assembly factor BamB
MLGGFAIAASIALLGAAPPTWPMYQYRPDHNAVFGGGGGYQWSQNVGAKNNGGIAVVGNTMYVETFAPSVVALDRRSGRVLWRTPMPNKAMTTPIVVDGLVIVGTGEDNTLYKTSHELVWGIPGGDEVAALSAKTGRIVWTYRTVGEDMPSPALVQIGRRKAIVFANGDDHVRALDVRTGKPIWGTPVIGVSTMASAAAEDGVVYVLAGTSADMHIPDHVYAVRASDGHVLWKAPYGNADCSPVLAGGIIAVEDGPIVGGPGDRNAMNNVYALDAQTGRLVWTKGSARGYFTLVSSNEQAIAGLIDNGVLFDSLEAPRRFAAFDLKSGKVLWSIPTAAAVKMSAVAFDRRLYFGDTAGVFYTVAESDGRVLSRKRFPRPFTPSSPVIVGHTLYISDYDTIHAIRAF